MKPCPFCAEEIQDAAIVCKHCGRDLSRPPRQPGMTEGRSVASRRRGGWALVLVIGSVLVLASYFSSSSSRSTASPERVDATVSYGAYGIRVTNNDRVPWTNVTFRLNPGLSGRYDAPVGDVAPGQVVTLPFSEFVNSEGERWNPVARKPQHFAVKATMNGQQADTYFDISR